jgi:hypothetical protein
MAKVGETVLDRAQRMLEKLNQDLSSDGGVDGTTDYTITFTQRGNGQVHEDGDTLLEFKSLDSLMGFLDSKFAQQVRAIRKGRVG